MCEWVWVLEVWKSIVHRTLPLCRHGIRPYWQLFHFPSWTTSRFPIFASEYNRSQWKHKVLPHMRGHGHGKEMHYLPWIQPARRECRSHRAAACRGNTLTSRCFGRRARAAWSSGPYWLMDELHSTQQRLEFESNHTMCITVTVVERECGGATAPNGSGA